MKLCIRFSKTLLITKAFGKTLVESKVETSLILKGFESPCIFPKSSAKLYKGFKRTFQNSMLFKLQIKSHSDCLS